MRVKKFKIPIYDYDVMLIQIEKSDKFRDIKPHLEYIQGTQYYKGVRKIIKSNNCNGAEHFYNSRYRRSLILLYKQSSNKNRIQSLGHEKRHLEDRLLEFGGIDDHESAGYLAGYLTKKLFT